MAPKQDEPTTPSNDNYEPQPVDNVSEFSEPTTSSETASSNDSSQSTDGPAPESDSAGSTDNVNPDLTGDTPDVTANEPAATSEWPTQPPTETQTTYVNPDNGAALAGATASGTSTGAQPPKRSRKKVLVAVLAGLVVVLAILAGLWFWYNSTNKVLGDAISQLLSKPISSSQGDFNIADQSNGDVKLTGNFSTKQAADKSSEFTMKLNVQASGTDVQVPLDVIAASNGDLYIKVSQVKQLLSDLLKSQNATPAEIQQTQTYFGGLISKVDDKWIKVSQQELQDLTKQAGQNQADVSCAQTALQQFYGSADQQNEIKKAFADHPLFSVDKQLGSKDIDGHNSLGYSLSSDNAKADAFAKAVADSQLVKNLKKCGSFSDSSSSDSSNSNPTVHAEAWVDRWNHQFTELSLSLKDKTTDLAINLRPSFNQPVAKVDIPNDATTITELKTQLQQTLSGLMMAEMSSQSSAISLQ